ncbi:MAG: phosphate acyltransferase [Planctomycetota bacterium]|jgi:phosphate acetyltransferase
MSADIIEELRQRAAARPATVVYAEPGDARIVEATRQVAEAGIARPILVGRQDRVPAEVPPHVGVEVIEQSDRLDCFAQAYAERRGVEAAIARRVVRTPLMYAAMMVALGEADAMVAGVKRATASVVSVASLAIGYREGVKAPSSSLIMVLPRLGDREDVPLVFADCAVNVEPSAEELAGIALAAADLARKLLGLVPRVAMLSFSTHGSAAHPKVDVVREATSLVAERMTDGYVDGELQLDAALVPAVVGNKVKEQNGAAGRANVLVFPDLNAGNIAYKAVQYFGGARAVGPILHGFAHPVSDLSRGASVADIVDATAVTVLQVQGGANSGP